MDHISLLCDEVWPSSPASASDDISVEMAEHVTTKHVSFESHDSVEFHHITNDDCKQALSICLKEEKSYIPKHNYLEYLESKNLIVARFRIIQWFIKCRCRFNLSLGTVFYAANYLDRFISMRLCNIEWQHRMVELLSIACLSIASKFIDTNTPTLYEINQMEDMEHSFEASTIQRMELMVLEALDWRLSSTTPHSYVQLFTPKLQSLTLDHDLHQQHMIITQLNHLLLGAISDTKLLEFRPSVVAASAVWCCLDRFPSTSSNPHHYSCLTCFFDQDQKDDLVRCHKMMEMQWISLVANGEYQYNCGCPSSPTTVLLKERNTIRDFNVDLSSFQIKLHRPNNMSCIKIKEEAKEYS